MFDLRNYEILDLNMKNPMFFKPSCYNQTEQKYVKHDFGKRFLINSDWASLPASIQMKYNIIMPHFYLLAILLSTHTAAS